jgi:hypothetical protein
MSAPIRRHALSERPDPVVVLFVPPELLDAAARATGAAEALEAGGEYKRHHAYAALLREFPQRKKRDLALAIELTLP